MTGIGLSACCYIQLMILCDVGETVADAVIILAFHVHSILFQYLMSLMFHWILERFHCRCFGSISILLDAIRKTKNIHFDSESNAKWYENPNGALPRT